MRHREEVEEGLTGARRPRLTRALWGPGHALQRGRQEQLAWRTRVRSEQEGGRWGVGAQTGGGVTWAAGRPGLRSGGSGKAAPRVTQGLQPRFVLLSPVSQGERRACCAYLRVIDSEQTFRSWSAVSHYCSGRGPSGHHLTAHLDMVTWCLPLIMLSHSGPACRVQNLQLCDPRRAA